MPLYIAQSGDLLLYTNRIFGTGWTGTGRYFLFLLKLRVVEKYFVELESMTRSWQVSSQKVICHLRAYFTSLGLTTNYPEVYYPTQAQQKHITPPQSRLMVTTQAQCYPYYHLHIVLQNWQKPFGIEILHCSSLWRLSQCHIYVQLICYLIKDDSAGAFWWTLSFIRFVILHTNFLCVFCICKIIIA